MRENKYFKLEGDISVPLSNNSPKVYSSFLKKQMITLHKLEEDLTTLPAPGEYYFLNIRNYCNPFALVLMLSKREPVKRLVYFTKQLTVAEYNAMAELLDKQYVETAEVISSTKPSFAESTPNFKLTIASIDAETTLLETHHNHYVLNQTERCTIENKTHYFMQLANDKQLLEFRYSILNNPQLAR